MSTREGISDRKELDAMTQSPAEGAETPSLTREQIEQVRAEGWVRVSHDTPGAAYVRAADVYVLNLWNTGDTLRHMLCDMALRAEKAEAELAAAKRDMERLREHARALDSVIDQECVAVSCINAVEDLRNAIRALKERAACSEGRLKALCAALKGHVGDTDGYEFGLGRVKFENGSPVSFLWAGQAEIDAAIRAAMQSDSAQEKRE